MTPYMKILSSILCLAVATYCQAEDSSSATPGFFTHENPDIRISVTSEETEVSHFVNLGLKECLYGNNAAAQNYFDEALRTDEYCVMAHIGMLMVHPIRSEAYRQHLRKLNECLEARPLNPVEEWYVSTFIQYLNGDLPGAAQAFREHAAQYRRDAMAACWDIVLNLYAGEKTETLLPRADKLVQRLPQAPLAHFCRAILEQYEATPSETALQSAETAVRLTDKSPNPLILQLAGHLAFRAGQFDKASACFKAVQQADAPDSEAAVVARLYLTSIDIASGDKKRWVAALKGARELSMAAAGVMPDTEGNTLLFWEGRTMLLRMLVLQQTPPGGAAINIAAKSCNAPEGHPLRIVQNCLVESIRARSLAETGRVSTAAETFTKAEKHLVDLQRAGESAMLNGGVSRTCYQRALRACSGALYRAKLALYKDSSDIWQPYLDNILNTPEARYLPPVLPHSSSK